MKKLKKIIIGIVCLLFTAAVTFGVCYYDYNKYYDPNGSNGEKLEEKYMDYVKGDLLEVLGKSNTEKTEDRISLFRALNNYYYSKDPMFKQDVIGKGGDKLFTIAVYKNYFWQSESDPDKYADNRSYNHYRYEIFMYDINYNQIQEMFIAKGYPDKSVITSNDYCKFVVNLYPNGSCNKDEAMITLAKGEIYDHDVINGDSVIGLETSVTNNNVVVYDYGSNPTKNKSGDVFYTQSVTIYDYSSFVDNADLFDNGAYLTINPIITDKNTETIFGLNESFYETELKDFSFDLDKVNYNEKNYYYGTSRSNDSREYLNSFNLDGVLSYNKWIIKKYIWWQGLIAFVVAGILSGALCFCFCYDFEKKDSRKLKKLKK